MQNFMNSYDKNKPDNIEKPKNSHKKSRWKRRLVVMLLAVAYGWGALWWFSTHDYGNRDLLPMAFISFLILVPVAIGAVSSMTLPEEERRLLPMVSSAIFNVALFLVVAVITYPPILFCVLLASPFVLVPVGVIALIMWLINRRSGEKRKNQYAFVGLLLILPFVTAPFEATIESPIWNRRVEDSVIINASAEEVWENIIRMDTITEAEHRPSWYHAFGIPRPIRATLSEDELGATRTGYFEYGLTFNEEITVWEPNEAVVFDVSVEHNDQSTPVLMQINGAYFGIQEAGYTITPINDQQVELTLYSDYRLSTNFNFYAVFWSDWIMHDFQRYVLTTVQARLDGSDT